MVEPADLRNGDDPATWWGVERSGLGTVAVERLGWPRGVVVGGVGGQESAEVGLAQNEEVIQALAADGADHPLHEGVLPGRAGGGEDLADPHALDSPREGLVVDRVSITEPDPGSRIVRECLDDLPGGPDGRGVGRDVDMEEVAAVVAEHDEDGHEAEGQGRHEEEVHGDDRPGMRGQKDAPGRRGPR